MTRYYTFLDGSTSQGSGTISGVQQNGGEFGIGISSDIQVDNLNVINSIGIGTDNPICELDVVGDANVSGTITANEFVGNFTGNSSTSDYADNAGISTVSTGLTGVPNIEVGIITATSISGITTITPVTELNVNGGLIVSGVSTVGLASTSNLIEDSTLTFELVDDTTLAIKVRGTDGVIRSANISLS